MSKNNNFNNNVVDSPNNFSLKQYKSILFRLCKQIQDDNLSLVSAGVAFYFLLAIFPLLTATVSLYGLLIDPDNLQAHVSLLVDVLPVQSQKLVETQLRALISQSSHNLTWGFALSIIITLWSASKGAEALITACNITYNESSKRGFFMAVLARLAVTIVMIFIIILTLALITILPAIVEYVADIQVNQSSIKWATWPILFLIFNISLATLYRYAPHRSNANWKWVVPGAVVATVLWVATSVGFSVYVSHYSSYNETYGSLGGIIILLMWFYLSAFIVLLGSEFNAALELQTQHDSTTGEDEAIGDRGATVADTLPEES